MDWQTALALETGSVILDGMLFFVPAKVGTQEGGKVALFAALGLSPARGLTVGVVRRIRELAYAGRRADRPRLARRPLERRHHGSPRRRASLGARSPRGV